MGESSAYAADHALEGAKELLSMAPIKIPAMSDGQFAKWQSLVEERLGTHFPKDQKSRLQSSLSIRMREIECLDFDQYYDQVKDHLSGLGEWLTLVDRLVIGETRFYRDSNAMALAYLVMKSRLKRQPKRALGVWSVGCSSGEESYSLAFLCESLFRELKQEPRYGITGIDVSWGVLSQARAGEYDERKMSGLPKTWKYTFFDNQEDGVFRIVDEVKRRVCFAKQNMRDLAQSPVKEQDLIYCQNVLIYFRKEMRHEILDELGSRLALGGVLIIGAGEALDWKNPRLKRVDDKRALAFQRVS
jgi:chemotaxis protein methyltransferase CheR/type IV pilus assembly protein PilK